MADRGRPNRISAEQAANLFSQLVDDSDNSEDEVHSSGSEWEVSRGVFSHPRVSKFRG